MIFGKHALDRFTACHPCRFVDEPLGFAGRIVRRDIGLRRRPHIKLQLPRPVRFYLVAGEFDCAQFR